MTESFTLKRVLNTVAVHKRQSAYVLIAPALLLACSLQAFARNSIPERVKSDAVKPCQPWYTPNGAETNADGTHFMCLS
jgi:hypothetical protein